MRARVAREDANTERGRVLIGKGGTINGFLSALEMAPEDGVGVVVLTNTGGLDNRVVPEPLAAALTRHLLGMPGNPVRGDIAPHPEVWGKLRGWYAPDAGPARTCSRGWGSVPGSRWPCGTTASC